MSLTPSSPPLALEFQRLSVAYDSRVILRDITLSVQKGQVLGLMGGSGSGKTTLLRAATGQISASGGTVNLLGHALDQISHDELLSLRKRIGVLFQHGALLTDLNVFENVAFPLREHRSDLGQLAIVDKVLSTLDAVGLRAAAHLKINEISGGMARRVALARAIVLDPEVIFFDEPFAGLDPISLGVTARLIRRLTDSLGCASVMITHDIPETFEIADQVCIIGQGQIMGVGTPAELSKSTHPYVKQFLGGLLEGPVAFEYPDSKGFQHWLAEVRA